MFALDKHFSSGTECAVSYMAQTAQGKYSTTCRYRTVIGGLLSATYHRTVLSVCLTALSGINSVKAAGVGR